MGKTNSRVGVGRRCSEASRTLYQSPLGLKRHATGHVGSWRRRSISFPDPLLFVYNCLHLSVTRPALKHFCPSLLLDFFCTFDETIF